MHAEQAAAGAVGHLAELSGRIGAEGPVRAGFRGALPGTLLAVVGGVIFLLACGWTETTAFSGGEVVVRVPTDTGVLEVVVESVELPDDPSSWDSGLEPERRGPLLGQRVVRGRELACVELARRTESAA